MMDDTVKVVEVEQINENGIVVLFSDGQRGRYSAGLLASINQVNKLPSPVRDRFWIGE